RSFSRLVDQPPLPRTTCRGEDHGGQNLSEEVIAMCPIPPDFMGECQQVWYQGQEASRNPVPYAPVCPFLSSTQILLEGRRAMHSAKHVVRLSVGLLCLAAFALVTTPAGAQAPAGVPVFQVTPGDSKITFHVNASVAIEGTFDQWKASLTFTSPAA